ncbi:FG-GAP-like repeat-containing protein [Winogradskyella aurantia]|uniref:RNA-binding protein n=1 Tax=Winogradskyella aurantia TaxID=1915063 RepID=A0A265UML3_9FLAO|nr:FG-GAP-like repeat-containing protein [Winogradskyella aurantia]OZV66586.1 hypothetical protein CA834_13915 [Winogradskyella aurantia]
MRFFLLFWMLVLLQGINAQLNFEDRANLLGLTNHTGTSGFGGYGVSFVDFDDDGLDDITMASGNGEPVRFYKNFDGFVFAEVFLLPTSSSFDYRTRSVTWVDFDNDGDKDFFLTSDTNGNRLFQNQNGVLTDITVIAGFPLENLFTYGASWGDIDNDGCLDVYLSNRIGGTNITNYLFKNNCDGTFSEVTEAIGLANLPALSFCSGFFDFNNDGWLDLYVANDKFKPNYLYKNNGDGTFSDVSTASGTDIVMDAMSVTIDDFNADGYYDIFLTNTPVGVSTPVPGSVLFKNNGDETFTNISSSSGTNLDSFSWGSSFLDADKDTDLDLYINTQYTGDNGYPSYAFYENLGDETFHSANDVGFTTNVYRSYSCALGDYNNDGNLELLVNNDIENIPSLWENMALNTNNYISIALRGIVSNADGIASKIEISINGDKQFRHVMCGEGYLSQNSLVEHFGLGSSSVIDHVKVTWPSGIVDVINNVTANQKLIITEGSALSVNGVSNDSFQFFPNPVKNTLTLTAQNTIDYIILYNTLGQIAFYTEPNTTHTELDLSALQRGTYFLKVTIANGNKMARVIKQ